MRRTQNKTGAPIRHRVENTKKDTVNLTLDDYFEKWIDRRYATAAKQSTPYRYEHWYHNHIKEVLGGRQIDSLRRSDILDFQSEQAKEYSPSTVNYTILLLKIILNDAVSEEIIQDNPADRIKDLKSSAIPAASTKHRALTEEEQKRFMQAAKASFYYEFFAFLLLTGMRHGEAAALTWEDVDYDDNVIHITKSLTFDKEGHVIIGTPKSAASIRDIPMNEKIRLVLQMQRDKTLALLGEAEMTQRGMKQLIFYPRPHPEGVLHNTTANLALKRILEEMHQQDDPIEQFSLHALRDTFATRFIEQGGRPQTLKTILGHSSLAMTMDLYSHVLPNTRQKEMDRVKIRI